MKTFKQTIVVFVISLALYSFTINNPSFEGTWVCKKGGDIQLIIKAISKNTYEIKFDENDMEAMTGKVDDGVLVVDMFGHTERFSIKDKELKWSGVFADECNVFIKKKED
uniref:hypothetical protein n=1 Tax=Gelidibacter sp. TaxID=2018083 RepID=UPI004049A2E3